MSQSNFLKINNCMINLKYVKAIQYIESEAEIMIDSQIFKFKNTDPNYILIKKYVDEH